VVFCEAFIGVISVKRFLTVIVLLLTVILFSIPAYADVLYSDVIVNVQEALPPDTDEFSVTGAVPVVAVRAPGVSLTEFQNEINLKITEIISGKLEDGVNNRARGMAFSYNCETDGSMVSVVIYTSVSMPGHTRLEVNSVNFDKATLQFADINAVLGPNGVKLINSYLNNLILTDISKYNPNFTGLAENPAFYVFDGSVHLVFNSYEITKGSPETETVTIPIDAIVNYEIEITDDTVSQQSLAAMLPLREVCEYFGFEVMWRGLGSPIEISRDLFKTEVTMGVNIYKKGLLEINLESPPLLINGVAFAPITFFEEILGLSYYVSDTSVTVSEIVPVPEAEPVESE